MTDKSNAHIVLNVRDRTGGQYNAALFNAQNQNIIQGDIKNITVSEVNFPYDIPNVQTGFNNFTLTNAGGAYTLEIVVPPGFYTGLELEAAINAAITVVGATEAPPLPPDEMPTVVYNATENRFRFSAPTTNVGPPGNVWRISSPYTLPYPGQQSNQLGKDILSIMGYLTTQDPDAFVDADPVQGALTFIGGASAPLAFTQYIDICSPQLCKFQYFRDGSTTNLARRSDVICRLYISNNIALTVTDPDGTRPFIINRQFFNARRMRWTADNSVGTIDINLYDDVGQPLTTTWQPRPYQVTFNAMENSVDEGLRGGEMLSANGMGRMF